ncbi:hypothetical protein PAL_GLEAN10022552 [Pteropus alecto]|uniref:Uncharacterized protein n=1 Tax=Pteropus alecto TaxID=9402 RepID=L5JUB4_PTEAL|nr:hypothetical protein PAL_GLEAN10022552 [Pteropus alecto]
MAVRPLPAPPPGLLEGRLRPGLSQDGGAATVSGDGRREGTVHSSCLGDPGWGTYRAVRSGMVQRQLERKCAGKGQRTAASGVTKGRLETADRTLGALAKNCPGSLQAVLGDVVLLVALLFTLLAAVPCNRNSSYDPADLEHPDAHMPHANLPPACLNAC